MASWTISVTTSSGFRSRNWRTVSIASTNSTAPKAQWMWHRNVPSRPSRIGASERYHASARAGGTADSVSSSAAVRVAADVTGGQ